jgi:plasmid maintenance system antidote protein VapI
MARPLRIEYPGAVYHVSSKGNERIQEAVEKYGYTQREVADHLGIHLTSVSRIMRERRGC